MAKILDMYSKKCMPARIYFGISIFFLVFTLIQNIGNTETLCFGHKACYVGNTWSVIFFQIVYIFLWTWFLDYLCRKGYTNISWILLLLPYIMLFIFITFFLMNSTIITYH